MLLKALIGVQRAAVVRSAGESGVFICRYLCKHFPRCLPSPYTILGGRYGAHSAELERILALHSPSPCFTRQLLKGHSSHAAVCPQALLKQLRTDASHLHAG